MLGFLVGLPTTGCWLLTRPHKIDEVTNPAGTMVAQVYQHDGIVSFGSTPVLRVPEAAFVLGIRRLGLRE